MRLFLIRHGKPDYGKDCLLPEGRKQAEMLAAKLEGQPFDAIYSSTCGRAYETALPTAESHGLTVTKLAFMREIGWGTPTAPYSSDYHPWERADAWAAEGKDLLTFDAYHTPYWQGTFLEESYRTVSEGFDAWFSDFGLTREGIGYRVTHTPPENIALFAHGGSGTCLLSHLTGIPLYYLLHTVKPSFTGITVIEFDSTSGVFTTPILRVLNDASHLPLDPPPSYSH